MKSRFINMAGERHGLLTVQDQFEKRRNGTHWLCLCDCGNLTIVNGSCLRSKNTQSCGCLHRLATRQRFTKHGYARHGNKQTREYQMWCGAKNRARKDKVPFNIQPVDIIIPAISPLLEIPLDRNVKDRVQPNSPSLDRIIPELGYIKGNIVVISFKANTMKSNASLEELETLAKNLKSLEFETGLVN